MLEMRDTINHSCLATNALIWMVYLTEGKKP